MKNASAIPLPPQFEPLIPAFAERAGCAQSLVREVLENVYRQGFADGLSAGLDEAIKQAAETLGVEIGRVQ